VLQKARAREDTILTSDALNPNSQDFELSNPLGSCTGIGNQHVDFGDRAQQPLGHGAQLAVIGDNDLSLRVSDKFSENFCLGWMSAGQALFGVDPIYANKHRVRKEHFRGVRGQWAYERKPVATQLSTSHDYFDILLVTQLHRNVDGVGYDGNSFQRFQTTSYFGGGCAATQGNGLSGLYQFGGSARNAPLFVREAVDLVLKGSVVPEWLIKERADGHSSSTRAPQQAATSQVVEVATDGCKRSSQLGAEFVGPNRSGPLKLTEDVFVTSHQIVCLSGHTRENTGPLVPLQWILSQKWQKEQ